MESDESRRVVALKMHLNRDIQSWVYDEKVLILRWVKDGDNIKVNQIPNHRNVEWSLTN